MNGETLSTRFAYHYDLTLSLALPGPEFSAEDREGTGGLSAGTERRVGRQQKEKGRGGGDEAACHRRRHDLPAAETE